MTKRLTILLILIFCGTTFIFGQAITAGIRQQPSFSGTWILDREKSNGFPPGADQTMTIDQAGETIEVKTKTVSEVGEQNWTSIYVLNGKETPASIPGPMPGSSATGKLTAKWSADGKGFESVDEGSFEMPGGSAVIKTSRKFSLSSDGGTLILEILRKGPMTQKSTRVYTRSAVNSALGRRETKNDKDWLNNIGAYLDEASKQDSFSGAVLIAKDGTSVLKKAYGLADKQSNTPNSVDTKFNLGSINKSFTSIAIAQLAQAGQLKFSDTISKLLPEYPNKAIADKVTIHQLLTHTSGMSSYFNEEYMKRRSGLVTLADYLTLFANDPLDFEPGTKMQYSNSGYVVLGMIIEKLSGGTYFDYVQKHIFEPAGMKNTGSYKLREHVPNIATGYTNMGLTGQPEPGPRKDSTPHLSGRGNSAGGGYSTLDDMLKFGRALMEYKLLNKQFTEIVLSNKMSSGQPSAGYGFLSSQIKGTRVVGNNGGGPGINTAFNIYPDLGYTVIVLSNYDPPSASNVSARVREMLPITASSN